MCVNVHPCSIIVTWKRTVHYFSYSFTALPLPRSYLGNLDDLVYFCLSSLLDFKLPAACNDRKSYYREKRMVVIVINLLANILCGNKGIIIKIEQTKSHKYIWWLTEQLKISNVLQDYVVHISILLILCLNVFFQCDWRHFISSASNFNFCLFGLLFLFPAIFVLTGLKMDFSLLF